MADLAAARGRRAGDRRGAGPRSARRCCSWSSRIKAALLPLHFWLPATYAEAPPPVAALFAIMTKVGAYAILRMHTLVFPAELAHTAGHFETLLMPAALATLTVGTIGILWVGAAGAPGGLPAVIGSMGTLFVAIALLTHAGTVAALYYLIHSTFAAGGAVPDRRPRVPGARAGDGCEVGSGAADPAERARREPVLRRGDRDGGAAAAVGLPRQAAGHERGARLRTRLVLIGASSCTMSLVALVGFARAGSTVFWKTLPASHRALAGAAPGVAGPGCPSWRWVALVAAARPDDGVCRAADRLPDGDRGPAPCARGLHPRRSRRRLRWCARILPHPLLTLLLALVWMLLENAWSAGVLVFGLFLGIVIPIATSATGRTGRGSSARCCCVVRPDRDPRHRRRQRRRGAHGALQAERGDAADMGVDPARHPHARGRSPSSPGPSRSRPARSRPTCRARGTACSSTASTRTTPTPSATRSRAATNDA